MNLFFRGWFDRIRLESKRWLSEWLSRYAIGQDFNTQMRHNFIIQGFEDDSEKTILDLGCGFGTLGKVFETKGNNVYYADINTEHLNRIESSGQRIRCDGNNLPFKDYCFDTVLCSDVIEHVPGEIRDSFLSELTRTAKERVLMTISTFSSTSAGIQLFEKPFRVLKLRYPDWYYEHNASESPAINHVRKFVESHDFKVLEEQMYQGLVNMFCIGMWSVFSSIIGKYRIGMWGWAALYTMNKLAYLIVSIFDLPPCTSCFLSFERTKKRSTTIP